MPTAQIDTFRPDTLFLRQIANQAFSRASGAPLRERNSVRLLKNAAENYPAWLAAIRRGAADDAFRDVHHPRGRAGADVRGCADRARRAGREGAAALRLDGRLRQDVAPFLETPARRRRRGPLLQPAALRHAARLDQPRSPEGRSSSTEPSHSSPDCASARPGSAIPRGISIRGATRESSCAVRRSRIARRPLPRHGPRPDRRFAGRRRPGAAPPTVGDPSRRASSPRFPTRPSCFASTSWSPPWRGTRCG